MNRFKLKTLWELTVRRVNSLERVFSGYAGDDILLSEIRIIIYSTLFVSFKHIQISNWWVFVYIFRHYNTHNLPVNSSIKRKNPKCARFYWLRFFILVKMVILYCKWRLDSAMSITIIRECKFWKIICTLFVWETEFYKLVAITPRDKISSGSFAFPWKFRVLCITSTISRHRMRKTREPCPEA